jgi:hypothetical protein
MMQTPAVNPGVMKPVQGGRFWAWQRELATDALSRADGEVVLAAHRAGGLLVQMEFWVVAAVVGPAAP